MVVRLRVALVQRVRDVVLTEALGESETTAAASYDEDVDVGIGGHV